MESAKNGLDRIRNTLSNLDFILKNPGGRNNELNKEEDKDIAQPYIRKFEEAMDDDCNTADAIAAIFELVRQINTSVNENSSLEFVKIASDSIRKLCDVLGLAFDAEQEALDSDIEELIKERQDARKAKNFQRADEIRAQLDNMGIVLEDTREGVKWHRK